MNIKNRFILVFALLAQIIFLSTTLAMDVEEFISEEGKKAFFPGSFDPPSRSHLSTVISLIEDYKFETVYVVVNTRGPKNYLASIDERMTMLREGLKDHLPNIVFMEEPVTGKEPLKHDIQKAIGEVIWGVTGGDGWDLLPKDAQEDLNKKWVIMPRPELQEVEFPDRPNVVQIIPRGMEDGTSSSYIRKSIAEGNYPEGDLPEVIKNEIQARGLYQTVGGEVEAQRRKNNFKKEWELFKSAFNIYDVPMPEYKDHQSPEAWRDNFVRITVDTRKLPKESAESFWSVTKLYRKGGVDFKLSCAELMRLAIK